MYIPSQNIPNSPQEIICPMTGESYVFMENVTDPNLLNGALERLPNRFFQRPFCIKQADGQLRIIIKEMLS